MSNKQLLLTAATLIETRGLTHSTLEDKNGRLCIVGALIKAAAPEAKLEEINDYFGTMTELGIMPTAQVLGDYISRNGGMEIEKPNSLWQWNDGDWRYKRQTQQSVIETLRAAAAEL